MELPPPMEPLPPVPGPGVLVVLEPLELPLLMPDELPVELPVELPDEPLVPPAAPLDLLKWASHSERDTWPSLFLSTSEKLGLDELPDEDDVPPAEAAPDESFELEPDAEGDEDDEDGLDDEDEEDGLEVLPALLLPLADGEVADGLLDDEDGLLDDDDEDCATASVDSANITAAAVTLRV